MEGVHGGKLLDQVDIISSVSGGSVTAGWYALSGRAGLEDPAREQQLLEFLEGRWTGRLMWAALNPFTLMRYVFTPYTRSDVLADFFAKHLYGTATYADVLRQYQRDPTQPYVILNATDLGHESVFPFTQGRFDLLCSDLLPYSVADAVAASANFPLAFSPLGLENFSRCDAQYSVAWSQRGPPQWLSGYAEFDNGVLSHSYALTQLRAARLSSDYLQPSPLYVPDKYIHLIDGGVSDNLGVRSTLALEDDPARVPGLYLRLGAVRPAGYQNVRRVLYIVVNARTRNPGKIDQQKAPTGEVTTALRMADTQLDTSTLADQDFLIAELEAAANREAQTADTDESTRAHSRCPKPSSTERSVPLTPGAPFLSCDPEARALYPAPTEKLRFYVASVDFDMIPQKQCRDRYWLLGTNWGLEKKQVEGLIEMAGVILSHSPDMAQFYEDIHGHQVQGSDIAATASKPADFADACTLVLGK
jgi:Patatin-like phospholipase